MPSRQSLLSVFLQVLFRKVIGRASYGQVALFFSLIGLSNAILLWPLCVTLLLTGVEKILWDKLPWIALLAASALSLGKERNISDRTVYYIRTTAFYCRDVRVRSEAISLNRQIFDLTPHLHNAFF